MMTVNGASTHTVTVSNISTKEACQVAGQQHADKYNSIHITAGGDTYRLYNASLAAVYTCVEQGKF